jgi:hypothetical protein
MDLWKYEERGFISRKNQNLSVNTLISDLSLHRPNSPITTHSPRELYTMKASLSLIHEIIRGFNVLLTIRVNLAFQNIFINP